MLATIYTKSIRDRWQGAVVGAAIVGVFTVFGLAVYADLEDVIAKMLDSMPRPFLSVLRVSQESTTTAYIVGQMLNLIAPLILSGLAISIGAAAVAGEERDGTIGVLLGNPRSRTTLVVSKMAGLVTTVVIAGFVLWGGVTLAATTFGNDIGTIHIGAAVLHVAALAVFFGALANFIGSWSGRAAVANGFSSGLLIVSFLAAGLLPLVQGFEEWARVFPWYYFNSSQPVNFGADWTHLGVLIGAAAVLFGVAIVGVNRRDLRSGTASGTLMLRLRENPRVGRLVERAAGRAQVSNITVMTVNENRVVASVASAVIFYVSLLVGPMYNGLSDVLGELTAALPDGLLAMIGFADMSTPEGWYAAEMYSLVVPAAIGAVTVMMGTRALAGEEEAHTMGVLMANPVSRSRLVIEKVTALWVMAVVLGAATVLGVLAGSLLGGLGLSPVNVVAASAQGVALAIFLGMVALTGGAATGKPRVAIYAGAGVGFAGLVANMFLPVNEALAGWARLSPFYYYLDNQPLINGLSWTNVAVLGGASVVLAGLSIYLFERRDLQG